MLVQFMKVVDILGNPHLIFIAFKKIEVGEELLFDYNDKNSRLSFLKSCPVCSNTSTGKQVRHHLT